MSSSTGVNTLPEIDVTGIGRSGDLGEAESRSAGVSRCGMSLIVDLRPVGICCDFSLTEKRLSLYTLVIQTYLSQKHDNNVRLTALNIHL